MLGMPARQFLLWNIVGAVLWADGVLLIGYLLAQQIYDAIGDKIDHYILPVVALVVLISVLPILIEIIRDRRAKKAAAAGSVDKPEAGAAIGVVPAASIADLAESTRDDDDENPGQRQHRTPGSHRR
jgi:membrane-associated protein